MLEFIAAPENLPFSVALALMLGIAILEGITAIFGAALSGILDALIPDLDLDIDSNLEMLDVDAHSPNALSRVLSWLRIGKVPVLILLVVFLTGFGLIGLGIQSFIHGMMNFYLPSYIVSIPAVILALPVVRVFGGAIGAIMPKDETEAVSQESFIGRIATITLGNAKVGSPAEAKIKDQYGTTHYIMVEPDVAGEEYDSKDSLLIIKKEGHVFKVIKSDNDHLVD